MDYNPASSLKFDSGQLDSHRVSRRGIYSFTIIFILIETPGLSGHEANNKRGVQSPKQLENVTALIEDIEKDLLITNVIPKTLDEAKIMLNLKNTSIGKLKEFIVSSLNEGLLAGKSQNTCGDEVEYLQKENERLQGKLSAIQLEFDIERNQRIQLKEVGQS